MPRGINPTSQCGGSCGGGDKAGVVMTKASKGARSVGGSRSRERQWNFRVGLSTQDARRQALIEPSPRQHGNPRLPLTLAALLDVLAERYGAAIAAAVVAQLRDEHGHDR